MSDYQVLGKKLGYIGINPDFIEELLPPAGSAAFLTGGNNILIKNGKIEKLRGIDYLNSVSTQLGEAGKRYVLGTPIYKQTDGDKYLMAVTPSRLYYLQNDTTWTALGSLTDGVNASRLSYANIDNKFVFTLSDSGYVYYWDGTTFAELLVPATLKARFLLEFKTRLMLFRTIESGTEHFQRVKFSNSGAITTFSATNFLDVDSESVIDGAKRLEDEIIIYLSDSLYRMFWVSDELGFGHDGISEDGLLAKKTLCGDKGVHFWLAKKGLMEMRKGGMPRSLSKGKFDTLILDEIDPVHYTEAAAIYYPHLGQLFLTYPKSGSTVNDVQLIIDTGIGELVSKKLLTGQNYAVYGEFEKDLSGLTPDERKSYGLSFVPIIGDRDGYIFEQKITEYQDQSTNYESNMVFAPTFCGDEKKYKRLLQCDLIFEKLTDQDITLVIEIADEMNEVFDYSFTLVGPGDEGIRHYEVRNSDGTGIDIRSREFRVKIKDSNNPYGWKFHGLILSGYYSTEK